MALFTHMGTYKYYVVGAMALVLVAAGGYYLFTGDTNKPTSEGSNQEQIMAVATSTYATSSYSIVYSRDFGIDTAYANTSVSPTKPIAGVKFTIPMTMATGTNLSADSYVSVEQLPRAKICTGDIYLSANVRAESETIGGVSYSVASSTEGAAGSRYEEIVFAKSGSNPCTAVRYFIHSTSIENYPIGTVREFDRAALLAAFDTVRDSLSITQ